MPDKMVEVIQLLFPGIGLLLLVGGVSLVRKGQYYSAQSERIAETDLSDVASIQPGTVAIEGGARVNGHEGTVTTALTGEDALVSKSKVTTQTDHDDDPGRDDGMRSQEIVHQEQQSVPFLLEDDTGTVRVNPPKEADIRLDENVVTEHSRGIPHATDLAENPDAAANETVSVGNSHDLLDYRRRYEQAAIVPGEEVYVLGEAVNRANVNGGDYEITGGQNPEHFVVSDLAREDVRSGGKIGAYLAYAFGGVIGSLGLVMVLGGTATLFG